MLKLLCFLLIFFNNVFSLTLPHPSCTYYIPHLECKEFNLVVPSNFDPDRIPQNISRIFLDCPSSKQSNLYCNVVKQNAQPFPHRPNLHSIGMRGFKAENSERFPMNVLLKNVRHQIDYLNIRYSKIGRLDAGYFAGFSVLKNLILDANDITEVAVNTFQSLSSRPPVLRVVSLARNSITSLDWAIWQPIADSITEILLSNQVPGLESLHCSSPTVSLNKLNTLNISDNKLESIPKEVLKTMTSFPGSDNKISLQSNSFCPSRPDCSCCEMRDVFSWAMDLKRTARRERVVVFNYSCGSGSRAQEHMLTIRNSAFLYSVGTKNANALQTVPFNPDVFSECSGDKTAGRSANAGSPVCAAAGTCLIYILSTLLLSCV